MSVARASLDHMEVTENDIKRIPVRNLRVPLWLVRQFQ